LKALLSPNDTEQLNAESEVDRNTSKIEKKVNYNLH